LKPKFEIRRNNTAWKTTPTGDMKLKSTYIRN